MGGLIGSYQVPYTTVSECCAIVSTVVNKYNGQLSRQSLAAELKMAANGGGFVQKLASIKGYGLLQGTSQLTATPLGQTIGLSKDPTVTTRAKAEAFMQYPLYEELFRRVGERLPDDEALTNILVEITKTNRIEVDKKRAEIKKYYLDALQYLKAYAEATTVQVSAPPIQPEPSGGRGGLTPSANAPEGFDEIKVGDLRIWLHPDSLDDVSTAIALLQVIEKKLQNKKPAH